MDQSRTSTLIIQSKKSQKILLWVFVFVAILFICCAIVKSMILDRSSNLGIFLNLTPVIEVFLIIGGLLIALLKLRSFHKNYKLRVNKTKLWQHFSIVLLLLLLFLLDFFKTQEVARLLSSGEKTDSQTYDSIKSTFRWEITFYAVLAIYFVPVGYLLVGFLKKPECRTCSTSSNSSQSKGHV